MGSCVLYNNSSDKRVVTKSITTIATYSIEYKGEIDILNPRIILSYTQDVISSNYIYITELQRYFYIDKITLIGQSAVLDCSVDVLMSFKSEILNLQVTCERSNSRYNLYLNDGLYKGYQFNTVLTRVFPNGFNKNLQFVLAVGS